MIVRTIPQPLARLRFICSANLRGSYPTTPRMTWRSFDLGLARETKLKTGFSLILIAGYAKGRREKGRWETHPSFITSALARMLCTVHLASLQLLFFISVATTAPLWLVNLVRQSSAPPLPWALWSNSLRALIVRN